jgi:hypothetical protein
VAEGVVVGVTVGVVVGVTLGVVTRADGVATAAFVVGVM